MQYPAQIHCFGNLLDKNFLQWIEVFWDQLLTALYSTGCISIDFPESNSQLGNTHFVLKFAKRGKYISVKRYKTIKSSAASIKCLKSISSFYYNTFPLTCSNFLAYQVVA